MRGYGEGRGAVDEIREEEMIDLAALLPICTSRISPPHLPSPSSLAHLPSPSPLPISPPHLPSPSSLAHLPSPTPDLFTAPATLRTTLPFPHLPIFAFSPLHPLRLPIRLRPRKWRWQLQSKRHGVPMHTPTLHSLTRSHLTRCTRSCIFADEAEEDASHDPSTHSPPALCSPPAPLVPSLLPSHANSPTRPPKSSPPRRVPPPSLKSSPALLRRVRSHRVFQLHHHSLPHHSLPHHSLPHHSLPHHSSPHHSLPHHSLPHHSLPHHSLPHHSLVDSHTTPLTYSLAGPVEP
ncbi:unnamed protein product [Closterium sp. NIES-54]